MAVAAALQFVAIDHAGYVVGGDLRRAGVKPVQASETRA
jgi:hypothetical protein